MHTRVLEWQLSSQITDYSVQLLFQEMEINVAFCPYTFPHYILLGIITRSMGIQENQDGLQSNLQAFSWREEEYQPHFP